MPLQSPTDAPRSTPCDGCHAGCCRSFAIPISGADAIRLERAGHEFWDFACRWEDREGRIANGYAPHVFFADEPQTPFVFGLRHEESRVFRGTPRCLFLRETPPAPGRPLGTGQCGVYGDRPAACRVFPKKLSPGGDLVQLQPVPDRGRQDDSPVFDLCPRPWTAADVDPVEAPGEIVSAEFEMRFFAQLVRLWNRTPQEWAAFPQFLRAVYGNRVREPAIEEPVILPFPTPRPAAAAAPRRAA